MELQLFLFVDHVIAHYTNYRFYMTVTPVYVQVLECIFDCWRTVPLTEIGLAQHCILVTDEIRSFADPSERGRRTLHLHVYSDVEISYIHPRSDAELRTKCIP